ncbi:MAG: ArnT family glycosyltransferase, partial [Endomicrobiia bacterium]
MNRLHNLLVILAGIIIFISFYYGIDRCGLFDVDEAIYAEVAREMIDTKNYIVPYYNYLPYYHKPILYYWILVISYKIFGINEIGARIPSVFFSFLLIILSYYFLSSIFDRTTAIFSSIILATNLETIIISKSVLMDSLLVFLITTGVYCFLYGYLTERKNFYIGFYVCSALATLTKGPIGILIPVAIVLLFLFFTGEISKIRQLNIIKGSLIFITIAFPWYIAVSIITKGDFTKDFFFYHNITRFSQSFEGHSGTIFYYVVILLIGFYPWSSFLPNALIKATRYIKEDKKNLFLIIWSLVPFVLFSIAKTKLPNYIFPVFVPASILIGKFWKEKENSPIGIFIFIFLTCVLSLFFGFTDKFVQLAKQRFNLPYMEQDITLGDGPLILSIGLLLFMSITLLFLRKNFKKTSFCLLSTSILYFNFISMYFIVPKVWYYMQGGLYN